MAISAVGETVDADAPVVAALPPVANDVKALPQYCDRWDDEVL